MILKVLNRISKHLGDLVAAIDNLTANVAKLSTDVAALIAEKAAGPTEAQVQAQADAVAALDATVVAATTPAAS